MKKALNTVVIAGMLLSAAAPAQARVVPEGMDLSKAGPTENPNVISGDTAIAELKDANSPIGRSFMRTVVNGVVSAATEVAPDATEDQQTKKKPSRLVSKLQREIKRYKISVTLGKDGEIVEGNPDGLGLDAYYQAIIEPNFRKGEQIRRDVYVFGIGVGNHALGGTRISAAAKTYVRVTFSRIFSGPKAKLDAIWAMPYVPVDLPLGLGETLDPDRSWTGKLPLDSNDIKSKMKIGDTARIEILGNLNTGIGKGIGKGSVGLSMSKEAIFLVDTYKHSATQARLRIMGLQNKGRAAFHAGVGVRPDATILKKISAGISLELHKSFNPIRLSDYPVDTMMVDYLYRFDDVQPSPIAKANTAEEAINEIMGNVLKLKFLPLFSLLQNQDGLADTLKENAKISETLAKEDQGKKDQARVRHLFKGRILADVAGLNLEAKISRIVKGSDRVTSSNSYVISEDSSGNRSYYLLESASRTFGGSAFFGRLDRRTTREIDTLVSSNENREVGDLMDVVSTLEIRDNLFDPGELGSLRTSLLGNGKGVPGVIPADLQTTEVKSLIPNNRQHGAYFRLKASYGLEAFKQLARFDKPTFHQKLIEFIQDHPERALMHLPCDTPEPQATLAEYTDAMSTLIFKAVSPTSTEAERMTAFRSLLSDPVFQNYVFGEFLPQFLDKDKAKETMGVELHFTSEDAANTKTVKAGDNEASNVYRFVSFMRSVLSDRSYDLRLDTILNSDNTLTTIHPKVGTFKAEHPDPVHVEIDKEAVDATKK